MKNPLTALTFLFLLAPLSSALAAQGSVQGGLKDYSVAPVPVTSACPSGQTGVVAPGSTGSAGSFTTSSTTGTTCAIKWANGQFPAKLICVVSPENAAALAGGTAAVAVAYAGNVPTLTVTWTTTEATAAFAYVCVGQ